MLVVSSALSTLGPGHRAADAYYRRRIDRLGINRHQHLERDLLLVGFSQHPLSLNRLDAPPAAVDEKDDYAERQPSEAREQTQVAGQHRDEQQRQTDSEPREEWVEGKPEST
jgi:hypothetical protein